MKKLACVLIAVLMIATMALGVAAATGINANEQAVLDMLGTSKVVGANGWSFQIPTEYVNAAKNYFAGDCDMSDGEKTAIIDYIKQGMEIVKQEADSQDFKGAEYNLSKMSTTARNKVLELGQKAAAEVELNLVYTNGEVVITPVGSTTPVFSSAPVIKTTGEDFPITGSLVGAVVAVVLVLGTGAMFVVSKKFGLLVK